ncbi:MAG: polyprenyl synthetase family protein, partial [Nannocystaceae bacterium]
MGTHNGLTSLTTRLREIEAWLGDDLHALDAAVTSLVAELSAPDPGGQERRAAGHLLGNPGKRIRPLCVLLGARFGGRGLDPMVRGLAVSSELIHAATLLHDDVLDQ